MDFALFIMLVAAGFWVMSARPFALDVAAGASLAGALFGAAAILLANWISRANDQHKAAMNRQQQGAKLTTLIAAEMVDVTAGLLESKQLMDAAIKAIRAGGTAGGQIDLSQFMPRGMPLTESLGTELLLLEGPAVDALATLRSNLAQTRKTMEGYATVVKATNGISMTIATALSNALGHDMTILAEVFMHIAPTRQLRLPGEDGPRLASDILKQAALPPT
jgi:hypothetical protein